MAGILDRVDRLRIGNPTNGTSTDADDLSVEGDVTIEGNLTVDGNITPAGNMTIAGNLAVTGTTTLTGRLVSAAPASFSDALDVSGASVFSNTAKFSGRVDMERGLISRQQASFSQAIDVTGAAVFSNTAKFSGRVELERGAIVSQGILLAGDVTPLVGTVALGGYVDARVPATGRGTIVFPGSVVTSNAGWLKVYSGELDFYIPMYSSIYSRA